MPVSEYDSEFIDSFTKGAHLIVSYPGGQTRKYNIDPNYAAMIAAARVAEDAICRAIGKAAELRPPNTPITPAQRRAWQALAKSFGSELCTLQGLSIRDIAEAGVQAMQTEAEKLMQNESVRQAYEQFQLLCKLTQSKPNQK